MNRVWNYFGLFTSFSTLICCALPALLVTLGLGATLATLVNDVPALIYISEHKTIVFLVSGVLLLANGIWMRRAQSLSCPIGSAGEACKDAKSFAKPVYITSVLIYLVGFYFAFVAAWLAS